MKEAKLLINLRNPEDKYTKYSFPSKTFEYMVSGTPFFTTKLEGIPSEYYNYLYCIDSYETNLKWGYTMQLIILLIFTGIVLLIYNVKTDVSKKKIAVLYSVEVGIILFISTFNPFRTF